MDIEVPFITDDGIPLHQLTQDEQRGYTIGLTVEQANSVIQHSARLSSRLKSMATQRAEMRAKSRSVLRMPEGATEEVKQGKLKELTEMKEAYDKLEADIETIKAVIYKLDKNGELVIPRLPKA
jgi:hypothetical protein